MTATITGTVTATHDDARTVTPGLPGAFPLQAYTVRDDQGTEHTVVVVAGSAAGTAFGDTAGLLATAGQRVTATGTEKPFGVFLRNAAGFTVED